VELFLGRLTGRTLDSESGNWSSNLCLRARRDRDCNDLGLIGTKSGFGHYKPRLLYNVNRMEPVYNRFHSRPHRLSVRISGFHPEGWSSTLHEATNMGRIVIG
jgi:hypothetical protein